VPSPRELLRGLLHAVAFLTIIPAPGGELDEATPWFPVVGALVGAIGGGVRSATFRLLGPDPSTVLALIAMVAVTGALHQDGLADTFDGLGVRGDRERRLNVMRDSSTGAFGVLALIGWALLLYTALAPLNGPRGFKTLVVAGALSRAAILLHGFATQPARSDGLGASVRITALQLIAGGASAAVIALIVMKPGEGAISFGVAAGVAIAWTWFSRRAFGGRTGDSLGAAAALTELAVCLALLAGA
jgi:adenosylcobinamide-GDP ribazoletransferase